MAQRGHSLAELTLTDSEREQLQRWVRRRKSAQDLALRSRIVLECATGVSNSEVARRLGISLPTVGKWRSRFIEQRLDGLVDEPRPGRPATVSIDQVEQLIVDTLESTPKNATHWSRASMAEKSGLSKSTVGRIWKAFGLKPHLEDGFKLSTDPLFTEKIYDIVGLYLHPPESAVVLCVDEKSQVRALARFQPALPMMPGTPPAAQSRLRPAWHDEPVRGDEHYRWDGDFLDPPEAPLSRVQEIPGQDRQDRPRTSRCSRGL